MMADSFQQDEEQSFEHELAGKYLTFNLKDEYYGMPIKPIKDIIEMQEYTEVPQTAPYVRGVVNLRGTVIPVIDLRQKFGMDNKEYDKKTCIIVVNMNDMKTGLIVDRVLEVLEFSDTQIDPAPAMSSEIQVKFISGIGKRDERVYILLDLDKIMEREEIEELSELPEAAEETPVS